MNSTTPAHATLPGVPCAACGATDYAYRAVLWPELTSAWELGPEEEAYINRQQGLHCRRCGNNLRMISLAAGLLRALGASGNLADYCRSAPALRVLEINTAGFLTQFLRLLPGHRLVEYPASDMMDLAFESGTWDVVLHSDSLEHVADPVRGLAECRRVLRDDGQCVFTVPVVVGRMSRSRDGLPPSYHGQASTATDDQLVRTEFGADLWQYVLEAGFASCEIFAYEAPAALVVIARKAASR